MSAQYLHDLGDDVFVLRRPKQEHYRRGALLAFAVPVALLATFWAAVFVLSPTAWVWLAGGFGVSLVAGAAALAGFAMLLTGASRAKRDLVRIDLAERWIERSGGAARVLKTPDAIVVRPRGLGWVLGLRHGRTVDALLRVPRSAGRDLCAAAEALADHLEVDADIVSGARRATGLVPASRSTWAALIWSPLDGFNLAYAFWALWTSDDDWLRQNARHALAQLTLETLTLTLLVAGLLVPTLAFDATPAAVLLFLILPIGGYFAVRAGLRSYVAYRARAGERWPAPWLGWLFAPRKDERPPRPPPGAPPGPVTRVGAPW